MKRTYRNAVFLLTLLAYANDANAAEFINLDFEDGYKKTPFSTDYGGWGLVSRQEWLPGWKFGDNTHDDASVVGFNTSWRGASDGGTLYGKGYFEKVPFFGNMAVLGFRSKSGVLFVHISQTGLIPADAKSIWYDCVNGPWQVTVNGVKLDLYDPHRMTKPDTEFREIGVDVSEWAGKEVELRLTPMPGFMFNALDNIRFSAEAIPEPKRASLLVIGWAALWVMSRR